MDTPASNERLGRLLGFLEQDPGNLPLLHDAANEALQGGLWSQARKLIEAALAIAPSDQVSRYRMAVVMTMEGQGPESLEYTQALIDEGVDHPAVLFQHARALILAQRHAEAEPLLCHLQPHSANLPEFDYLHIRSLHAAGKLDEAIALAEGKADDVQAQAMLSLLYVDAEDVQKGGELARQVLEKNPDSIDALLAYGTAALAMEEAQAALPRFEHAARLHAENGRAWMGIGLARMSASDLSGAREAFEKTVRFLPAHLGSWNALAWIELLQNDLRAAEETLEAALRQDRNFGETHGTLAVLRAAQQQWDEAKRHADIAVRLQPESFAGRFAQTLLLEHRGRPQQAQYLLRQMMEKFRAPAGGNLIDVVRRFTARQGDKNMMLKMAQHSDKERR
jgi:tetratricopeptide (TPR) repeat protein